MGSGDPHRGTVNDPASFAPKFVLARLAGFEKDCEICLTPMPSKTRRGMTHAYFPTLSACCSFIEYLTALHRGNINGVGWPDVAEWAQQFLPQPDYDSDVARVLFQAFRHPIAHRGISSGVWIDRNPGPGRERRLTWKVLANGRRPSVRILAENGQLETDPPWPCLYTHQVHIHLRTLKVDIRNGARLYAKRVGKDPELQDRFAACMRQLYPG